MRDCSVHIQTQSRLEDALKNMWISNIINDSNMFHFLCFINMRYYMGNPVGFYIVLLSQSHFINVVKFIDCVLITVCANHFYYFRNGSTAGPGIVMFLSAAGCYWWCSFSFYCYDMLWTWRVRDTIVTTDEWPRFTCFIYRFNISKWGFASPNYDHFYVIA